MTIKPVADMYLIKYEDGRLYKCTRDAEEAVDAIGFGFEVEEFVSLENHRAAMLQGAEPVTTAYKLPEGWVAVPVEPTAEMVKKMRYYVGGYDRNIKDGYEAMLAAAPQQE